MSTLEWIKRDDDERFEDGESYLVAMQERDEKWTFEVITVCADEEIFAAYTADGTYWDGDLYDVVYYISARHLAKTLSGEVPK
jgi:hypothetical protein